MAQPPTPGNPYTLGIAAFVAHLRYEAIPPDVVSRMKLLILDALGCGIYGAALPWSGILQRSVAALDATPACVVWGTAHKLSAPHAALVNGSQVQGFELDDMHHLGIMHTGSVVLPGLLSVAETHSPMSGEEFLAAAVAGYEVGPRVGICMNPWHLAQGWHSDATCGTFAAAAGAARGLRLNVDQTVHALGIAGTQASGLMAAQYGAMVKRMHAGRAAQSGLYAALLAGNGYTGIANVFESEYGGYCTTFSRSTDRFRLDELTAGFGSMWQTMDVRLKFYACMGSIHATLDAVRELRDQHPFDADAVASITVYGTQVTVDKVGWPYVPQGVGSAQFNLAFCVATLLLEGECFVDQFTEDKLTDSSRIALSEKISVVHDPAILARGPEFRQMVRVEICLKDGTRMERSLQYSRDKEHFPAADKVSTKFDMLAARVLPSHQAARLRDAVLTLETLPDAALLARLMAAG